MSITFTPPTTTELKPRIVVIGVGGAGGNAVNNMISSGLEGVEFLVTNTDAQALAQSQAERKIQLGVTITEGLGCGARPDIGRAAAEEVIEQIIDHLSGTHMAFITAGMGGGTGTGGAPVIAQACRDQGILTVGVVTKPFHFEGTTRMRIAEGGIEELQNFVDTLIIIPNQNLFRVANEKTTFADAFAMADDVLHSGVRGITDLMVMPGLINLDFADVKTVMGEMGKAMMGTGEAEGEKRALDAAEAAISNPLLDEVSMKGANGVLINITGGLDLTLYEVDEAANRIREEVDPDANIIVGSALDENLAGLMRVSVVATGIDAEAAAEPRPKAMPRLYAVGGNTAPATEPAAEETSEAPAAAMPERVAGEPGTPATVGATSEALDIRTEPLAVAEPAFEPEQPPLLENAVMPVGNAVPQPKPLMPERDPMLDAQATVVEEVSNEPFIAPPPVKPRSARDLLRRPHPIAEADAVNADGQRENRRQRGLGLFARMTSAARSTAEPAAEAPAQQPQLRTEPVESTPAVETQPAPETSASPSPADQLAPPRQDEDLLEIPSFLRRQAN